MREGGRLDPDRLSANVITLPRAGEEERRRCHERLARFGYAPAEDDDRVLLRAGREDVLGFYHLCTLNSWREIAVEQLGKLRGSGLADRTARIFATVVGPEADEGRELLREELGERVEFVAADADAASFERPILEFARRFCLEGEPLAQGAWYAHAKGVSSRHVGNSHVVEWRRLMEHFVIDGWEECLASLSDHDACGVNWHAEPRPHFSGNFWWATPRYLANLPETIGSDPFEPEAWIGSNQPRTRCLHESGVDHYLEPYPERLYA